MSKTSTPKTTPSTTKRTKAEIVGILIPLLIVGAVATAISYATLIDVAKVNGIPLPELFPILIDVGTLAVIVVAAQFRQHGLKGRWLAYTTFVGLSALSVFANASHALRSADFTLTTVALATTMAAIPPLVLLSVTHLFIKLIPDTKERERLQRESEKRKALEAEAAKTVPSMSTMEPAVANTTGAATPARATAPSAVTASVQEPGLRLVPTASTVTVAAGDEEVAAWIRDELAAGNKPTGAAIGERLNKSDRAGQRLLKRIMDETTSAEILEVAL